MLKGKAHLPREPVVNGLGDIAGLPGLRSKNTGCPFKWEFQQQRNNDVLVEVCAIQWAPQLGERMSQPLSFRKSSRRGAFPQNSLLLPLRR